MVMLAAALGLGAAEAKLDGQKVYYEVTGKGSPTLVLVHGWSCDGTFFARQLPELAKEHRVVTVDLIGHGRSDKPEIKYDGKTLGRSVLAAMDAAGVDKAVLIGHSMGLPVIRSVYADAPSRVIGLVSLDGSVFSGSFGNFIEQMKGPSGLDNRKRMLQTMFAPSTSQELRDEITKKMTAAPEHVAVSAMEFGVPSQLWKQAVSVPTLAIQQKRPSSQSTRPQFERAFTNLDYREMEGVGHFLMMEKPAEVNAIILPWVAALKP